MTKEEVLQEFEKLGYKIQELKYYIYLEDDEKEIIIDKDSRTYNCSVLGSYAYTDISIHEHRLLHQLFYALGWLNYE